MTLGLSVASENVNKTDTPTRFMFYKYRSKNYDAVTYHTTSVFNVRLVCGRRFLLQLSVMLVSIAVVGLHNSKREKKIFLKDGIKFV